MFSRFPRSLLQVYTGILIGIPLTALTILIINNVQMWVILAILCGIIITVITLGLFVLFIYLAVRKDNK